MERLNTSIKNPGFWANIFKPGHGKEDLEQVLLSMPPFQRIGKKYIQLILNLVHNRVYSQNEYVFCQGDPGIGLFFIQDGEIRIFQKMENGKEFTLAKLVRGDFFGEIAMLEEETRSANALALRETKLAIIFKPDLDKFMEQYPHKGMQILRGITQIVSARLKLMDHEYISLYNKFLTITEEQNNEPNKANISAD